MALELRPNCECCDKDLPPHAAEARICSYECTFCADCVERVLHDVCPNCGGGFVPRPIRPATEWRPGLSVAKRPPSTTRRSLSFSLEEVDAHSRRIRQIAPAMR
ncbi:MAG: DUF1272 domain-containing protein [Reyranellaceae bacterium]